jgi:pimeloyl-ACP methyl ester carboxylesterase
MRYIFVSPRENAIQRVLVAVHGVSREWRELSRHLASHCIGANTALVIPRFSRSGYRGYQRLEAGRKNLTSDIALLKVLDDVAERFGTGRIDEFRLFGYSGGAQFAHRFSLLHPDLVKRQALAASGFYTMPDANASFPFGLGEGCRFSTLDSEGLTLPTKVFVGDLDVQRDPQLRTGRALDRQQGLNRLERAQRFVVAVRTFTAARGLAPDCSLEILRGCDHSFVNSVERGNLAKRVVDFLVPETTDHLQLPPLPSLDRTGDNSTKPKGTGP